MSSNATKMTLEERVVQTIKSDTLMALVGDEDAITELAKRAIHEALYQPQRTQGPYSTSTHDSIAVAAARDVAKEAATKVMKEMVEALVADDAFRSSIRKALADIMPGVMQDYCSNLISMVGHRSKTDAVAQVQQLILEKRMPGL